MRGCVVAVALIALGAVAGAAERENQGVYGADPTGIAYDAVHNVAFVTAQCVQSCFKSTDYGQTWEGTFPVDSLSVGLNATDTTGWGGGAFAVMSHSGLTIVQCREESGNRWSTPFSTDGGNTWSTLFDRYTFPSWLTARCTETGVTAITGVGVPELVKTYGGRIFVVVKDFIFWSADNGSTWDVIRFPDSSMAQAGLADPDTAQVIFDLTFFGATGDSFYVLASGPQWEAKSFLDVPDNWKYMKAIYVTRDNGDSFALATDTNRMILYEDQCANPPGSSTFEPCTMGVFNIHHIACTPSGDTIFVQDGAADGSSIDFSPMMTGSIKCLVSTDGGLTWQLIFKEGPGNNLGHMDLFCDPALPTGMRLFLGSSRYTDSAGPVGTWQQPDSVGYGEMNRTPATMDLMLPGAQTWMGLSDVGPFVSTDGIDARFQLCITGLEAVKIYDIAQLTDHPDTVFLATHMGLAGTKVYTDVGVDYADKWTGSNGMFGMFNGEVKKVEINPNDPSLVVAVGMNGFRVTNGTGSIFEQGGWTDVRIGFVQGSTTEVYVNGLDWSRWSQGGGMITGLAFMGEDTVLASFSAQRDIPYGGLMVSFDRGQTWTVNPTLPDSCANDVAVSTDGQGNTVIVVVYGTERVQPSWGYVMKSTGDLDTWVRMQPGMRYLNNQQSQTEVSWPVNVVEFVPGSIDSAYLVWGRFPAATWNGLDSIMVFNNIPQDDANRGGFTNITVNKNSSDSAFFAQGKIIWCVDMGNEVDDGKGGTEIQPVAGQFFRSLPGEVVYDVLYDDLTMSSSTGYYAIQRNVTGAPASRRVASVVRQLALSTVGTSGRMPSLRYALPGAGHARLTLFDTRGRTAAILADGERTAGVHAVSLDRQRLSVGMYIARLEWRGKRATASVAIVK